MDCTSGRKGAPFSLGLFGGGTGCWFVRGGLGTFFISMRDKLS